jgi:choline dehydrogenase-like flavoprotein
MIATRLDDLAGEERDVCVIGAGTIGIPLALELERLGRSVLLLESGGTRVSANAQRLADADIANPDHHVAMDIAVQRRLGGASNLWGGRCVVMEEIDFTSRPFIPHSGWPITLADVMPYYRAACDYLGCGEPVFDEPIADLAISDRDFLFSRLERWSARPRVAANYVSHLRHSEAIDLRLSATVVGLEHAEDGRISRLRVRDLSGTEIAVTPRCVVLAAGGLENTRLLLSMQRSSPNSFGGPTGPLGRYYMGHLYGLAAEMVIHSPTLDDSIELYLSRDNHYVRRRFTPSAALQQREGLTNVSLWPDYPAIRNPEHRNGVMSFAYLALANPWIGRMIVTESIRGHYVGPDETAWLPHLVNILRDAPRTAAFIPAFIYRHYLARPRMPGFFQRNAARRYSVRFHAEHLPNPNSRVTLTRETDALGLPRLAIDLKFTDADTVPLIRTHECFGDWLESTGLGTLIWSVPQEQRSAQIIGQCYDGHHQIGTTRMSTSPTTGVVDRDCRVHGSANLFVASSSVFPTSGEANPTLTALALALRSAALIAREGQA